MTGTPERVTTSVPDLVAAIGPRVRTSPFFPATVGAGVTAVSTYNHMWLPMSYGDPQREYERLTTGVSMWDVAAQRHTEVSGPDADAVVELVTAVDTSDTDRCRAIYAPMCDHEGRLINDPVLFHWHDGTWRFSISDSDVRLWLQAIIRAHEFRAEVAELDTATLAIQGPKAVDVIDALGFEWFDELDQFEQRPTPMRLDDGPAVEVVVSKSGWSTQGGCEIFLDDATRAVDLWNTVAAAGEPFDIGPGAPNATERIENVLLSYGTDTGYDADPIELGLTDHLDLDRPDFIGQAALRRIRDDGPKRRLRGVVIDGDDIGVLQQPVPFTIGGDRVGLLRAATHSPRFESNIGLALLDASCTPGDVGSVELADGQRTARLVELPFADSLGG